jgi:hypothetical protein
VFKLNDTLNKFNNNYGFIFSHGWMKILIKCVLEKGMTLLMGFVTVCMEKLILYWLIAFDLQAIISAV